MHTLLFAFMTKSYYIALTVTNTESSSLGLPELRSQALLVLIYLRLYQQAFVLLSLPPQQIANNSSQCLASLLTAHLPFTRFLWPSTTVSDNGSPVVMWWVGGSGPAEVSWYWGNIFFSQFLTQRRLTQPNSLPGTATVWTIEPMTYQVGKACHTLVAFPILMVPF